LVPTPAVRLEGDRSPSGAPGAIARLLPTRSENRLLWPARPDTVPFLPPGPLPCGPGGILQRLVRLSDRWPTAGPQSSLPLGAGGGAYLWWHGLGSSHSNNESSEITCARLDITSCLCHHPLYMYSFNFHLSQNSNSYLCWIFKFRFIPIWLWRFCMCNTVDFTLRIAMKRAFTILW